MYTLNKLIRQALSGILTLAAFLGTSFEGQAQSYIFIPDSPHYTETFNGLTPGSPITSIDWTNTQGNVVGAASSDPEYPGSIYITNSVSTQNQVTSTSLPLSDLPSSSVYYVSGYFYRNGANSGGRVLLRLDQSANYVGGFGIDSNGNFVLYSDSLHVSALPPVNTKQWYEIAFVVALNEADITQSKGYLFYRNVTAGETEFTLVDDLSGILLGYTESHNFSDFARWRIEGIRNSARIGEMKVGTGTLQVIPEAGTTVLILSVLTVGGVHVARRKRRS